jgi:hypothetical protein
VHLNAPGWLIRIIEGDRGKIAVQIRYRPSVAFGRRDVSLRAARGCIETAGGPSLYHDLPGLDTEGDLARTVVEIAAGERYTLVVTPGQVGASSPISSAPRLLEITRAFWQEWISYCRYDGPYGEAVRRSALALKLLAFAPTGAIAAAPTTSLPEQIGGTRNWDYRYCWLRDAAFTLYALAALGYGGEAYCFSEFLQRACAATFPDLQIMYGIGGEPDLAERTLDHLEGYRGSRPVRSGMRLIDSIKSTSTAKCWIGPSSSAHWGAVQSRGTADAGRDCRFRRSALARARSGVVGDAKSGATRKA